jgi:hypothetical protein
MDSARFRRKGFIYSHCAVSVASKGVFVNIFVYDVHIEDFYRKGFKFFRRLRSRSRDFPSRMFSRLERAQEGDFVGRNLVRKSGTSQDTILFSFFDMGRFRGLGGSALSMKKLVSFVTSLSILPVHTKRRVGRRSTFGRRPFRKVYFMEDLEKMKLALTSVRSGFYSVLGAIIRRDLSNIFSSWFRGLSVKCIFKNVTSDYFTASVISRYITRKLEYKYTLKEVSGPLLLGFRRRSGVVGLRLQSSGRFTRQERAFFEAKRLGAVARNTLGFVFDYSYRMTRLKYGASTVRVWFCREV